MFNMYHVTVRNKVVLYFSLGIQLPYSGMEILVSGVFFPSASSKGEKMIEWYNHGVQRRIISAVGSDDQQIYPQKTSSCAVLLNMFSSQSLITIWNISRHIERYLSMFFS